MSPQITLKEAEQKAFKTTFNDGLWDILLGCFFLMFAIAPFLTPRLGDFWSSALFVPFWGLVYLAIWQIRRSVVMPRIGIVKFGRSSRTRLKNFSRVMLTVNVLALVLAVFAAWNLDRGSGELIPVALGVAFLIVLSIAGYFLSFGRLYIYGLLVGLSPPAGEWLYRHLDAVHHGFPITFGISAAIMILIGIAIFVRLLLDYPVPLEEGPFGEA